MKNCPKLCVRVFVYFHFVERLRRLAGLRALPHGAAIQPRPRPPQLRPRRARQPLGRARRAVGRADAPLGRHALDVRGPFRGDAMRRRYFVLKGTRLYYFKAWEV